MYTACLQSMAWDPLQFLPNAVGIFLCQVVGWLPVGKLLTRGSGFIEIIRWKSSSIGAKCGKSPNKWWDGRGDHEKISWWGGGSVSRHRPTLIVGRPVLQADSYCILLPCDQEIVSWGGCKFFSTKDHEKISWWEGGGFRNFYQVTKKLSHGGSAIFFTIDHEKISWWGGSVSRYRPTLIVSQLLLQADSYSFNISTMLQRDCLMGGM